MPNTPPESGLMDPFAFDEPYEQFRATLKGWYPEWRDARESMRSALLSVVALYQTAAPTADEQVGPWQVAGEALRAAGFTEWATEVMKDRGLHHYQRITTECRIGFAVWSALTAATAGDADRLSEFAGRLAELSGKEPEKVRAQVANDCRGVFSTWLSRAAAPFVRRVIDEAGRLGLTYQIIAGMPPLAEDNAEQAAYRIWLGGWAHSPLTGGDGLVSGDDGLGVTGCEGSDSDTSSTDPPSPLVPPTEKHGDTGGPQTAQRLAVPGGSIADLPALAQAFIDAVEQYKRTFSEGMYLCYALSRERWTAQFGNQTWPELAAESANAVPSTAHALIPVLAASGARLETIEGAYEAVERYRPERHRREGTDTDQLWPEWPKVKAAILAAVAVARCEPTTNRSELAGRTNPVPPVESGIRVSDEQGLPNDKPPVRAPSGALPTKKELAEIARSLGPCPNPRCHEPADYMRPVHGVDYVCTKCGQWKMVSHVPPPSDSLFGIGNAFRLLPFLLAESPIEWRPVVPPKHSVPAVPSRSDAPSAPLVSVPPVTPLALLATGETPKPSAGRADEETGEADDGEADDGEADDDGDSATKPGTLTPALELAHGHYLQAVSAVGDGATLKALFDWCEGDGRAVGTFDAWKKAVTRARRLLNLPTHGVRGGVSSRSAVPSRSSDRTE